MLFLIDCFDLFVCMSICLTSVEVDYRSNSLCADTAWAYKVITGKWVFPTRYFHLQTLHYTSDKIFSRYPVISRNSGKKELMPFPIALM